MTHNIDLFSVYAAKILDTLFDSFPIPVTIACQRFIEAPDVNLWIRKMDEVASTTADSTNSMASMDAVSRESQAFVAARREHDHLQDVFAGTLRFLVEEEFIRTDSHQESYSYGCACQLTTKGLTHLNREFKDKQLTEPGVSIIEAIKRRFSSSSSVEGATTSQVFVGLITRYLIG